MGLFPQFERSGVAFSAAGTIVLNDTLYIQGGTFYPVDGYGDVYKKTHQLQTIDLTHSWNNQTVSAKTIANAPFQNDTYILFASSKTQRLYIWGLFGKDFKNEVKTLHVARQHEESSWEAALDRPVPDNIFPTMDTFAARLPNTIYTLGGSIYHDRAQSYGLIRFDALEKKWTYLLDNPYGRIAGGGGVYIEKYGREGVLIFLAGGNTDDITGPDSGQSMARIGIYDIAENEFLFQDATGVTGEVPPPRLFPCIVGVEDAGDKGYDIFMYGGTHPDRPQVPTPKYRSVWVLSLPSFKWVEVPDSGTLKTRIFHSCEIVGNSQMAVIGGIPHHGYIADEFEQGLGIFDLSRLSWSSAYNPRRAPYLRPEYISNRISLVQKSPEWNSPKIKAIFGPQTKLNSETSKSDIGIIAGSAVGGGILLLISVFLLWYLTCRRSRQPTVKEHYVEKDGVSVKELDAQDYAVIHEFSTNEACFELSGSQQLWELPADSQTRDNQES